MGGASEESSDVEPTAEPDDGEWADILIRAENPEQLEEYSSRSILPT